jgi:catechol 2,3-dioxygenase-like lactoylglutathione lyase family enzyme
MAKFKIDHIGIVVNELDKIVDFYVENLGCQRGKIYEMEWEKQKFRYTFLRIVDDYVEILEPKKGEFFKRLKEGGEGTLVEICFEVDDIGRFYDGMKKKGITLTDPDRKPLARGKKYWTSPTGDKFAYLPLEATFGTWIEVLERAKT